MEGGWQSSSVSSYSFITTGSTNVTNIGPWIIDPGAVVTPGDSEENPQGKGEMSINVPPVTGKAPEKCAEEARVILKQMLMSGAPVGVDLVTAFKEARRRSGREKERKILRQSEYAKQMTSVDMLLSELREVAKHRKPKEIYAQIDKIKAQLALASYQLQNERVHADRQAAIYEAESNKVIGGTANTGVANDNRTKLQRVYALVQAIPVNAHAPIGKMESTLRAITAILKAHHGVDVLEGFDAVPVPGGMPIVMLQEVKVEPDETAIENAVKAALEAADKHVENGDGITITPEFVMPFEIWNKSGPLLPSILQAATYSANTFPYLVSEDVGVVSNMNLTSIYPLWSNGSCSLEAALDMLRCVRGTYTDPLFTLRHNGGNAVVSEAKKGERVLTATEVMAAFAPVPF